MSDRAHYRGNRGGGGRGGDRGGNDRGGRGGNRGSDRGGRGGGQQSGGGSADKKKENILDLIKYMDKEICVKFNGGREGVY